MQQSLDADDRTPVRTARGWAVLLSPLLATVLFFAVFIAAGIAIGVTVKPAPTRAQIQQILRPLLTSYSGQMAVAILVYAMVLFAIWLLLPKRGPASLQSYFSRVSFGTIVLALLSGLFFAFFVGAVLTELSTHGVVTFHTTRTEQAMEPHSLQQLGIALAAIAIVGPIVEEIYFRGILLRWLRSKMPLALAAIPDAAIFGAIHFRFTTHVGIEGWILTGALFLFGLFAVAWAAGTKSLWPSICAHGMYNATLISAPLLVGQNH